MVLTAGTIALALQAVDFAIEIVKGGATLIQGVDGNAAAELNPAQDLFSGAALIFSAGTGAQGLAESAVLSIYDFAIGKIPPGSFMSMNVGGVGANGERVVDATVVPPGATPDQTFERAAAAGLDPQGTYVDVAIEQNDPAAVLHSLEALRGAFLTAGGAGSGQGAGSLSGEALIAAITGTYSFYIPDEDTNDTLTVSPAGGGNIYIVFDPDEPPRLFTPSGQGTFQTNISAAELDFGGLTADGTFTFTVTESGVEAVGTMTLRSDFGSESFTYYCEKIG